MSNSNTTDIITDAHPHTVKKFELIEAYVEAWAHKLLEYGRNTGKCNGLVFIDCMCNSGVYRDEAGNEVFGTPIRVAKVLAKTMREQQYQRQQAYLYFNDLSQERIDELNKHLPPETRNFHIYTSVGDGNDLLKSIGSKLQAGQKISYLMVYDPYTASIDWSAIRPFFNHWGEVIINHMVSDSIRAVPQVKRPEAIDKYEQTYLTTIEELLKFGSDRTAYSNRVEQIITALRRNNNQYYIASYPFFNTRNTLVYDLIHCTNSKAGFKLYKSTAWSTFGDQSSTKKSKIDPHQMSFDFDSLVPGLTLTTSTDESCYRPEDIVKYIIDKFYGRSAVPLNEIWDYVDEHPVFPSDLYKSDIKRILKERGYKVHRSDIDFI